MGKLKVAYVASEAVPYSKTGGLADVAGALPQHLAALKHEVALITPLYSTIDRKKHRLQPLAELGEPSLWLDGEERRFEIWQAVPQKPTRSKTARLQTYFIACPEFFERDALYVDPATGADFDDNHLRFAFFARAVLAALERLNFQPDILHANDWQAALVPAYLRTAERDHPFFKGARTVLTIHNVAYQGLFPAETFDALGISKSLYYPTSPFEFWGKVNFLKAGIHYADLVTTVSETYAQEIQSANEFGYGLEGVLRDRRSALAGVINGVDYDSWSPQRDTLIKKNYDENSIDDKAHNKADLLRLCGFTKDRQHKPLIGVISRLADQKGFDLIEEIAAELFALDISFVLLGTGQEKYHELFLDIEKQYPDRVKVFLKFDDALAHKIEAGADIFLMPSRFEPCGLNQMYSLRYGTIPVARKTGGLADTIVDFSEAKGRATGFLFEEYTGAALLEAIKLALKQFSNLKTWRALQKRAMKKDFSWKKSAKRYAELYAGLAK